MSYAETNRRYSEIDLTTLSLKIITIFLTRSLALYMTMYVRKNDERISEET